MKDLPLRKVLESFVLPIGVTACTDKNKVLISKHFFHYFKLNLGTDLKER